MTSYYEANFRHFLPEDRNSAILDLGCGQGDFVRYLHGLGYRNITAVDIDQQSIDALQAVEGVSAHRLEIGKELPAALAGPWDLIVAKQMIYYLDRREAASLARSFARSLSGNGHLIVEIFNGSLLSSGFTAQKDPGILTAYTELGLKRLLEGNGLQVEQLFGANAGSGWLYRTLRKIWVGFYRLLLILDRGRDDELPSIGEKSIIAVARRA